MLGERARVRDANRGAARAISFQERQKSRRFKLRKKHFISFIALP
jgi:hypothetical protein